ncbi:MAG: GNAT family N-acetyltransferase [Anaerolineae bacterium]|nr:GNAT family N-acetyltransferase [Anaerolineae bacterium]MCI0608976.1 GNAT family N-acetyltransferase [Anaerolineae bacterium]
MKLDLKPASNYPLPDLTNVLNLSFENYLVPIQFNISQFITMLRKDSIDLDSSRVLLIDDEPAGIALIARRGSLRASRLAAMGISQQMRGKGAGSWFMEKLIQESRQRSDREMVLEVIEQNEPAVQLYQKFGFQSIRRLVGFVCKSATENGASNLHEIDLREAGSLISQHGLPDLPWQLSGKTIALMDPPVRAYRKGQAYAVISNPDVEHIVIWSLLVEPDGRGNELGLDMLRSLTAQHAGKTWHVPAILPEELGNVYEKAGFEKEKLSQWQMRLALM